MKCADFIHDLASMETINLVATQKQEINPTTEPAHFAFRFVPPEGWPKGTNRVRFSLDEGDKHIAEFQID